MNITTRMIKSVNFNNKVILFVIILFIAIITGIVIADGKWLYYGLVFIPLIIYLCIEKPFIFPFGVYVFFLPFDDLLSVMGSDKGATLTKFLGILTILVLSLKGGLENKLKKPDAASIWWILFIMYGVLSVLWAITPDLVLNKIPTAVGLLLLYLVASSYQIKKCEYETLKRFVLAGGLSAAILTIYQYTSSHLLADSQRATVSFGERVVNPNGIAFSLIIPAAVCIAMMLNERNNIIKALFMFVLGVILFGIVVTGSRSGMLGVATVFIIYILSIRQITFYTILIIIGVIILSLIPDFFVARWGKTIEGDSAGRLDIWYVGYKSLGKYWSVGAGLNNFTKAYDEFANYAPVFRKWGYASHNLYLGLFVQLGVVGITLMFLAILKHYKTIKSQFTQYKVDTVVLRASFWAILVICIFSENIWEKTFWLLWMMIMMYKNVSEDKTKERLSCNKRNIVSSE